jgi:Na+/H+-translocating membrane pyrophosphatase
MIALGIALVVAAIVLGLILGVTLFLAVVAVMAGQPYSSSPAYKELRRQFREQRDRVEAELARSRRN